MSKEEEEEIIEWLEEIAKALGLPPADWESCEPKSLKTGYLGSRRRKICCNFLSHKGLRTQSQYKSEIGLDSFTKQGRLGVQTKFRVNYHLVVTP